MSEKIVQFNEEIIKGQIKEARDLMNARFDAMEQGLAEKIKDYA